jgi:hypothetical protein
MAEEILLSKSNYWKTACINAALRGQDFTAPTELYIALYNSNPTGADTGQEITAEGYERQLVTFSEPVITDRRAVSHNNNDVAFAPAISTWGVVSHIGIRTAKTGGKLIYHGAITNQRTVLANDLIRLLKGNLVIDEG